MCGLIIATADPRNPDDAALREPSSFAILGCMGVISIAFIVGAVLVWRRRGPAT